MGGRCNNAFVFQSLFVVVAAAARSLSFHFLCTSVCFCGSRLPTELNKRTDKQTVHILHFIFVENISDHRSDHLGVYQGRKQPCSSTTKRERDHRLLSHFATIPPSSNLACHYLLPRVGRDERAWTRSQVRAWMLSGWRMGCPECLEQELSLNCLPFTLL